MQTLLQSIIVFVSKICCDIGNEIPYVQKKTLAIRGIEPVTFALLARRSNQLS